LYAFFFRYDIPINSVSKPKFIDLDGDHQSFAKGLIKGMINADPLKRFQLEDVKTMLLSP